MVLALCTAAPAPQRRVLRLDYVYLTARSSVVWHCSAFCAVASLLHPFAPFHPHRNTESLGMEKTSKIIKFHH